MEIVREVLGGLVVIGLNDDVEIDVANSEAFQRGLLGALERGDRTVVFDASRVGFFDSAGMGVLLAAQKRLDAEGGELVLAGLNRSVREVFRMVGLEVAFRTYETREAALTALG